METRLVTVLGSVRQRIMDAAQKAERRRLTMYKERVPCKAGCSGCCKKLVSVSMAEALIMYEHLVSTDKWAAVKPECVRQAKMLGEGVGRVAWYKMGIPCPVLGEDGRCRTYPVRPPTCSCHYVTSDPDLCDPWSHGDGDYEALEFEDLFDEFRKRLREAVRSYGIFTLIQPIPVALLIAETISVQSGMSLSEAISFHFKEI